MRERDEASALLDVIEAALARRYAGLAAGIVEDVRRRVGEADQAALNAAATPS